ncbi:MAG: glycosyltransferase family 4 protein [Minisyncoccota bacterium]
MRLLIVAQVVDTEDPVLGFFTRWIEEFAKHTETIEVICLKAGRFNLPSNVCVHSLGKEHGASRLKYIINFYTYIWRLRHGYDAVFVHMNQEYVLFGALLWRFLGKKVTMWRNHHFGDVFTRIAVLLSDTVFCTSKYSFTARFRKTVLMPVGIDTDLFKRDEKVIRIPQSVLFLGRISPVKKLDVLVNALLLLDRKNIDFVANIYGDSLEVDKAYHEKVKEMARKLEEKRKIIFHGTIPNYKTPEIYNQNEIFINLTESGSLDKTIFEAVACGCLPLTSNRSLSGHISGKLLFDEGNAEDLAQKLSSLLVLDEERRESLRDGLPELVEKNHSLHLLGNKLASILI